MYEEYHVFRAAADKCLPLQRFPSKLSLRECKKLLRYPLQYAGIFSDRNPIAWCRSHFQSNVTLTVCKDTRLGTSSFVLNPPLKFSNMGGMHSDHFNSNGGLIITKSELQRLVDAMEDTDTLVVENPDTMNVALFKDNISA